MEAFYISTNSFKVLGNKLSEFTSGRRLRLDCGDDGIKYASIENSTLSGVYTEITMDEYCLTSNLITVYYSVVYSGSSGNIPNHYHSGSEGDGGLITNSFIGLDDTISTYSGTASKYAVSTGSGVLFQDLPEFSTNFIDLNDSPSTYSGTEGQYAVSTGSGVSFYNFPVYTLDITPTYLTPAAMNDIAIDVSKNSIIKKTGFYSGSGSVYTAKSVVIDIADNYGSTVYVALRSIEFYNLTTLVLNTSPNAIATSYYDSRFLPNFAFNTSLPKDGDEAYNNWISSSIITNQRLIVTFTSYVSFTNIIVNNYHDSGTTTNAGAKNVKIYVSDDIITETAYDAAISNSTLIFDDQILEHVASDVADDQNLTLIPLPDFIPESGWDTILETEKSFLDLTDSPPTYVGTEGYFVKSTGSGIIFEEEHLQLFSAEEDPNYMSGYNIHDFLINKTTGKILEKNRDNSAALGEYLTKTIIVDITNNWGATDFVGIRQVDLYLGGIKHIITTSDISASGQTSRTPGKEANYCFDTTTSKTGGDYNEGWMSANPQLTNQRIYCVLNTTIHVDAIKINNYHQNGGSTSIGAKNIKIYITDAVVQSTTYGASVSNGVLIFDNQLIQHVSSDVEDEQTLVITGDQTPESGWDIVLETKNNFIELSDTPITYLGTDGYFAKSTGSGVVFEETHLYSDSDVEAYISGGTGIDFLNGVISLLTDNTPPPDVTGFEADWSDVTRQVSFVWDQVIAPTEGYYEVRELSAEGSGPIEYVREARSVIFSPSSNWGGGWAGLRQIDFLMDGTKITVDSTNCAIYRDTTEAGYLEYCEYAFYTNTSKTGDSSGNGYLKAGLFVIVFDEVKQFNRIVVNNYHDYGASTSYGTKDIKIYTTLDELNGTSGSEYFYYSYYNSDPNFENNTTLIFDGTLAQHVAADVVDDQIIPLIELTPEWMFGTSVVNTSVNNANVHIPDSFGGNKWYFIKALSTYGVYSDNAAVITPPIAISPGEPYEKSFLELTDSPATYLGAEGRYVITTTSGLEFKNFPFYTLETTPYYSTPAEINDLAIDISENKIIKKNRITFEGAVMCTSFIMDIADNYGHGSYLSLRSIEFYNTSDVLINTNVIGFTAYSTTHYGTTLTPGNIFDLTKSKIGGWDNNAWVCGVGGISNQRVICVFDTPTLINHIVVNNGHSSGGSTNAGAKNIKVYYSTDAITNTVYNDLISNSVVIYEGTLQSHIPSDVIDDQVLELNGVSTEDQDTGWDLVLDAKDNFILLNDTPATYSGTEGMFAKSTGSAVVFESILNRFNLSSDQYAPSLPTPGELDDFYISEVYSEIYKKNRETTVSGMPAKSVIIDVATNWGSTEAMGLRAVEFYLGETKIEVSQGDITCYSTTNTGVDYYPWRVFDTSISKIGSVANTSWQSSGGGAVSSQRLICVFDTPIIFNKIIVNNYHHYGTLTSRGIKNTKLYVSTSEITNTIYQSDLGSTELLFDGEVAIHPSVDAVNDVEIELFMDIVLGWDKILETKKNFIELNDAPTTYSGSTDLFLQSNGTDLVFSRLPRYFFTTDLFPNYQDLGELDDVVIDVSTNSILENRFHSYNTFSLKSVIIDIADNWGDAYIAMRSIEFFLAGEIVTVADSDITAYSTTMVDTRFYPKYVFITGLSKIGTSVGTQTHSTKNNSERYICVFDEEITADSIVINNGHDTGAYTNRGAKNIKIYTSSDEITSTVYGEEISNSIMIFDGQIAQHIASNVVDNQELSLINTVVDFYTWDTILAAKNNFIELSDTPITYSGTEGYFAKSTGSGIIFEEVQVDKSFLDLTDTVDAYDNTEGQYAVSTGSGVSFYNFPVYTLDITPTYLTPAAMNDIAIDVSKNSIIKKTGFYSGSGSVYTAKSVVIDIADNWGYYNYVGVRSVEFYTDNGVGGTPTLINMPFSDFIAYATTSKRDPDQAFDTSLSKTGDYFEDYWTSYDNRFITNQRLLIVFDLVQTFKYIVVNNFHLSGLYTDRGVKNIKIYTSDDPITNTTYGSAISNSTLVFDGQVAQHVSVDVEDDQNLTLIPLPDFIPESGWDIVLETKNNFIELGDTPITYSGTEGYFAKSTGSGIIFEEVQVDKSFLDLTDTETTYSGTEGYFAKSTGSGVYFSRLPIYTSVTTPDYLTPAELYDMAVVSSTNSIIKKNRIIESPSYVTKSCIIDIADNWGSTTYISIRQVDFYDDSDNLVSLIPTTDYIAYATTDSYHAGPEYAFDTSSSLINDWQDYTCWMTDTATTNTRLICVFNTVKSITKMIINNGHDEGGATTIGAKNIKIYLTPDTVTDTTYGASITNSKLVFDGQLEEHVAVKIADPQNIDFVMLETDTGWDTVLETKNNFIELDDTPTTYSGTEGLYAKSTGAGIVFDEVQVDKSFLDLTDTPITYSGIDGYYAKASTSGIEFVPIYKLTNGSGPPSLDGNIDDVYIDSSNNVIYKKTSQPAPNARTCWRIYISANNNEFYCEIASFELRATVGGADQAYNAGGTASASSTWGTGNEADMAFDGSVGTFWITDLPVNSWLQYEFTSPVSVREIYLTPRATYYAYMPKDFKLQYSDNGIDWEDAVSWYGESSWSDVGKAFSVPDLNTDTGWDTILETEKSFLDLTDTPTTYSGTEGYFAKSTGSGIVWSEVTQSASTVSGTQHWHYGEGPPGMAIGCVGDYYIDNLSINVDYYEKLAEALAGEEVDLSNLDHYADNDYGDPYNLIDGSLATYCQSMSYVAVDLSTGNECMVGKIQIAVHNSTAYNFFTGAFQGSNNSTDGTDGDWTTLVQITPEVYSSPTVYPGYGGDIVFDNSTYYRWYRLSGLANTNNIVVNEWRFYGIGTSGWGLVGSFNPEIPKSFSDLIDTPMTYSGTEGYFAKSTGSGIIFEDVSLDKSFLELTDTPTTYSGAGGNYLRLTSSGILSFDGVIITSPNMTEWLIKVTDQGTLYTEEL